MPNQDPEAVTMFEKLATQNLAKFLNAQLPEINARSVPNKDGDGHWPFVVMAENWVNEPIVIFAIEREYRLRYVDYPEFSHLPMSVPISGSPYSVSAMFCVEEIQEFLSDDSGEKRLSEAIHDLGDELLGEDHRIVLNRILYLTAIAAGQLTRDIDAVEYSREQLSLKQMTRADLIQAMNDLSVFRDEEINPVNQIISALIEVGVKL
jgi:hypothetical protein